MESDLKEGYRHKINQAMNFLKFFKMEKNLYKPKKKR